MMLGPWLYQRRQSALYAMQTQIETLVEADSEIISIKRLLDQFEKARPRAVLANETRYIAILEQQIVTYRQLLEMRRQQLLPELVKSVEHEADLTPQAE